jgi:excisionase family DNA binding protein
MASIIDQESVTFREPTKASPIAYTVPDAAEAVGMSQAFLYQRMERGELPYVKMGARRLIRRQDLLDWVDRGLVKVTP